MNIASIVGGVVLFVIGFAVFSENTILITLILLAVGSLCVGWGMTKPITQEELDRQKRIANRFVVNEDTRVFHRQSCSMAKHISLKNRSFYSGSRESAIIYGLIPCSKCNPK